jgi:hypothetical protein
MMSKTEENNNSYNDENWITIVLKINSEVRKFRDYLKDVEGLDARADYFNDWNDFYAAVCDMHLNNDDISYDMTSHLLFGDIFTLEDYVDEALKLVPPIYKTTKMSKIPNKRGAISIDFQVGEDGYTQEQINMHKELASIIGNIPPSTPESLSTAIDSTIRNQVKELETRLNEATESLEMQFKLRLDKMDHDIPITIAPSAALTPLR